METIDSETTTDSTEPILPGPSRQGMTYLLVILKMTNNSTRIGIQDPFGTRLRYS